MLDELRILCGENPVDGDSWLVRRIGEVVVCSFERWAVQQFRPIQQVNCVSQSFYRACSWHSRWCGVEDCDVQGGQAPRWWFGHWAIWPRTSRLFFCPPNRVPTIARGDSRSRWNLRSEIGWGWRCQISNFHRWIGNQDSVVHRGRGNRPLPRWPVPDSDVRSTCCWNRLRWGWRCRHRFAEGTLRSVGFFLSSAGRLPQGSNQQAPCRGQYWKSQRRQSRGFFTMTSLSVGLVSIVGAPGLSKFRNVGQNYQKVRIGATECSIKLLHPFLFI